MRMCCSKLLGLLILCAFPYTDTSVSTTSRQGPVPSFTAADSQLLDDRSSSLLAHKDLRSRTVEKFFRAVERQKRRLRQDGVLFSESESRLDETVASNLLERSGWHPERAARHYVDTNLLRLHEVEIETKALEETLEKGLEGLQSQIDLENAQNEELEIRRRERKKRRLEKEKRADDASYRRTVALRKAKEALLGDAHSTTAALHVDAKQTTQAKTDEWNTRLGGDEGARRPGEPVPGEPILGRRGVGGEAGVACVTKALEADGSRRPQERATAGAAEELASVVAGEESRFGAEASVDVKLWKTSGACSLQDAQSEVSGLSMQTLQQAAAKARSDVARMMRAAGGEEEGASALSVLEGGSVVPLAESTIREAAVLSSAAGSEGRRERLKRALLEEKAMLDQVEARAEADHVRLQGARRREAAEVAADALRRIDPALDAKQAQVELLQRSAGDGGEAVGGAGAAVADRYAREVETMKAAARADERVVHPLQRSSASASQQREFVQDVTIQMFADPACPWGYVSRRRIAALIAKCREANPEIRIRFAWRPFVSVTTVPLGGLHLDQFLARGTVDAEAMELLPGRKSGEMFRGWRFWPNSIHAQRLLLMLEQRGGAELVELGLDLLHGMTFEEGLNISTFKVLAALAAELGVVDPVALLRSKAFRHQVIAEHSRASNELEIRATPFFRVFITDRPDFEVRTLAGACEEEEFLHEVEEALLGERKMFGLADGKEQESEEGGEKEGEKTLEGAGGERTLMRQTLPDSAESDSTSYVDDDTSYGPDWEP